MHFEIVTHCLGYSRFICYQLSTLINSISVLPSIQFTYCMVTSPDDIDVHRAIDFFRPQLPANLQIIVEEQKRTLVMNRGVGRNRRAMASESDWMWFTDVDHLFIKGVWDFLISFCDTTPYHMIWAQRMLYTTYEYGDKLLEVVDEPRFVLPDIFNDGVISNWGKAIGGMHIARTTKLQANGGYDPAGEWESNDWYFRNDKGFRKQMRDCCTRVSYLNVLRIRHRDRRVMGFKGEQ